MKKGQEEIFLIASLLIPVIVFGLVMTILYMNFQPQFEAQKIMAVFVHDIGILTESAYAMPDNVIFRYTGPIDCDYDKIKSRLVCNIGNQALEIDKPEIEYFNIQSKTNIETRKIACEEMPYYGSVKFDWGFKDVNEVVAKDCTPATWYFAADYQDVSMKDKTLELDIAEDMDAIEIEKKRTEFYDTIDKVGARTTRNANIQDVVAMALKACRDKELQSMSIIYLPNYLPTADYDSNIFCISKVSYHPNDLRRIIYTYEDQDGNPFTKVWRDISCFDFSKESLGGEVPDIVDCDFILDREVNFRGESDKYDSTAYDDGATKDYNQFAEEFWHIQDSSRETVGDIRDLSDLVLARQKKIRYLTDSGPVVRAIYYPTGDDSCKSKHFGLVDHISKYSTTMTQDITFEYSEETVDIVNPDGTTQTVNKNYVKISSDFTFSYMAELLAVGDAKDKELFKNCFRDTGETSAKVQEEIEDILGALL